ncbi:MAG: DUF3343 domain-containing protein [bacterium]|nr:DUF3343 domain-containing protein [bacterium]
MRDELKSGKEPMLLFETTHLTMKAEDLFRKNNIPNMLFPKPKKAVSECGLVVKLFESDLERARELCINSGIEIKEVIRIY